MFDDFDVQIQSDEFFDDEHTNWSEIDEQDRYEIWSDFLEQMTYAND